MILARRRKREEEFNILSSKKGRGGETIGDKQFKAFLKKTTCIHKCTIICSITCNENVFQMYIYMYYFIDNSDFLSTKHKQKTQP
jgi:hypothetical protein